jgi:hypothetical protein
LDLSLKTPVVFSKIRQISECFYISGKKFNSSISEKQAKLKIKTQVAKHKAQIQTAAKEK